jgi:SAM-dependent methyltransferase
MSSPSRPLRRLGEDDHEGRYADFVTAVARRQLADWLPAQPQRILDLSSSSAAVVALMTSRGHTVVHADGASYLPHIQPADALLHTVLADPRQLDWLADESVDLVVAEGGALSDALVAELTLDELHRVLRPGGGLLLCVESLVSGLARLADQGRWAELADVPAADVVLIPGEDGSVSRCFWPEELHAILTDAGFDVDWIRPRTVLAEETIAQALAAEPARLASLVETELALSAQRQGESIGGHLVASARRR